MPGINAMIDKLEKVDINHVIATGIELTKDELKKVQQDQLLHGEGKNGRIGKYRNAKYAAAKNQMNPLAGIGNVDLRLTGNYQRGIFIDVRSTGVVIDSSDNKAADLNEKYGDNISGLNPIYAAEYSNDYLAPKAIELIKKQAL